MVSKKNNQWDLLALHCTSGGTAVQFERLCVDYSAWAYMGGRYRHDWGRYSQREKKREKMRVKITRTSLKITMIFILFQEKTTFFSFSVVTASDAHVHRLVLPP